MNNITRESFVTSIIANILTSLLSCSWANQSDTKSFQPERIELPRITERGSTLYEAPTEKVRGFTVNWNNRQGQSVQESLLRVFYDSVVEGVIRGLPKARLNVREGRYDVMDHDYLLGEKTAGKKTIVVTRASGGGIKSILVDGREQSLYDGVYAPKLSANGKHYAYCAVSKETRKQFVVLDGRKQEELDWCTGVVFSPDGERYAYVAGDAGRAFVVIDNRRGMDIPCSKRQAVNVEPYFGYLSFNGPEFISWSPDSERIAYVLPDSNGTTGQVFINEKLLSSTKGDIALSAWSNDSKHFAFAGKIAAYKQCVVLDEKQLTTHENILDFTFSPDGSQLAYVAWDSQEPHCRVFCQGEVSPRFYAPAVYGKVSWVHDVTAVVFSPGSKHLAYVARDSRDEGKWFVMLDGKKMREYDDILTIPVFEGNRIVYIAVMKGKDSTRVVYVSDSI